MGRAAGFSDARTFGVILDEKTTPNDIGVGHRKKDKTGKYRDYLTNSTRACSKVNAYSGMK